MFFFAASRVCIFEREKKENIQCFVSIPRDFALKERVKGAFDTFSGINEGEEEEVAKYVEEEGLHFNQVFFPYFMQSILGWPFLLSRFCTLMEGEREIAREAKDSIKCLSLFLSLPVFFSVTIKRKKKTLDLVLK